ncbi:MAG TPA: sulfite exporter TauE/SafE family protein [Burkholderiaceae bacterium]|nr:sulfite exporter TauE/SafE family protein [Burkholderiaceae bacterium]
MIGDPLFWAAAAPAVLLAGVSKASGNGLGMVAVPLMALAMPPPVAAAVMLPILCAMDLLGLWAWRGRADRAVLATILPGAMLGIGIGTLAFGLLDVRWVEGLLGAEAVAFALHRIAARHAIAARPPGAPSRWAGGFWGAVSGFTSTLAHAGNPPLMQYLLPLRLDKERFVATTVVFFTAVNAVKLVPYAWLGLFDGSNLLASAALLPLVPVGYRAGVRLVRRLPEAVFQRVLVGSLLVIGTKLLANAFVG